MDKRTPRRRHSDELRQAVLKACEKPGASIAAVALAHGLNANLVHKWRRRYAVVADAAPMVAQFIPLELPAVMPQAATPATAPPPAVAPVADIRIELRRGATAITVNWPVAAASECGEWLRQWLK